MTDPAGTPTRLAYAGCPPLDCPPSEVPALELPSCLPPASSATSVGGGPGRAPTTHGAVLPMFRRPLSRRDFGPGGRCAQLPLELTSLQRRFLSRVDTSGDCWLWRGNLDRDGYGTIGKGQDNHRAHRIAYLLFKGTIPPGLNVLHSCDVRPCVKPAHLRLGSQAENMADRNAKRRTASGERNGRSKLTGEAVAEIRRLASQGLSRRNTARLFGIDPSTVRDIVKGRIWAETTV